MNIVRIISLATGLFAVVSIAACSDGGSTSSSSSGGQSSGGQSSGGQSSGGQSSGGQSSGSQSQSCSAAAVNGRCYDGPKKGSSCCMPDFDTGKGCESGTDCDTVCRHCE